MAKWWPKDGARLAAWLKRTAPALRSVGIEVEQKKSNGKRSVVLSTRERILLPGSTAEGDF